MVTGWSLVLCESCRCTWPHNSLIPAVDDMLAVSGYLLDLDKEQMKTLGLILGLSHRTVSNSYEGSTRTSYLNDILHAWLLQQDEVKENGSPSWIILTVALEHKQLRQTGIAKIIREDRL